jgi:G-patch domain
MGINTNGKGNSRNVRVSSEVADPAIISIVEKVVSDPVASSTFSKATRDQDNSSIDPATNNTEIKVEDVKTVDRNIAKTEMEVESAKTANYNVTRAESDIGNTKTVNNKTARASKHAITFSPASSSAGHSSIVPTSNIVVIPMVTDSKVEKPRPVKTNAWGKPVKNATWNDDGDVVGEYAPPVGADGKGKAMMEKMGWTNGMGLGKENNGIREPVALTIKTLKGGLGAKTLATNESVWPAVENTDKTGNPPIL